jgi:hypothetical protein
MLLSEGNAAHPVRCDSPLQIVMAVWRPFLFEFKLSGSGMTALGQEPPKDKKALLRPDFQANTRPRIFLKSQCHHKIQEDSCEEIQV